ncbi:MAG TPA: phage antirepressor KilAC domain-containing protein [Methanosarcina sp.]|nr:phage antirepressor KilAC domain-containing protein [Methanosarcina sp.]
MELITVSKSFFNGAEVNSVNARDLHNALEIKKAFSTWIQYSLDNAGAINGEDFIQLKSSLEGSGYQLDYIITTDMAKHIAMMSKVPKGKEVRDYFIKCEKQLMAQQFKIPQTYSEALLLASKQAEQIEQQKELLAIQAPKADFYDAVTGSKDTVDIGTVAKVLNMGIGRTKLFQFLRDNGVLMKDNQPYQKFIDAGWFRVIESRYTKPDGSTHINTKTVVYQKGIDYIRKMLEKK